MSDDDEQLYKAIIQGRARPDPTLVGAGYDAHVAGLAFHQGPQPLHTIAGLCWRIGWNNRAMGMPRAN